MQIPPQQSTAKPRKRGWRKWLAEIVVLLIALYMVHLWQTRDAIKGSAPALVGLDLHNRPVQFDVSRGQPVLVHFWASWCPICELEQGTIASLGEDIPVMTVAMQSGDNTEVSSYLDGQGLSLPVINDPDGDIASRWGVRGVPTSYIIRGDGTIAYAAVGYTTWLGLRARLWLAGFQ